jgi:molybdopterin/thiamine biosynthesis adenylyltransferase
MSAVDDTRPARLDVELGDEDGRYHRQTLISWWEQDRLRDARILVVGAGALGNELVKNLALAGIGTVVVIDMDLVENSNLSRCVFFRLEDEGRPKAEVVCERASELNPEIRFVSVVGDVRHDLGLGDYAGFDAVLGGLDNREARLHVNQACWKASTPWVDGAIEGLMGIMRVFVPPESACYECTMSARDHELLAARKACSLLTRNEMLGGKVPTTGTSASVIAAMQVQEVIKLLHADQLPTSFAGQGVAFNGMTHDSYTVSYPRREVCLSHDTYDLAAALRCGDDEPLADVLRRGRAQLEDDRAVLDLECDVVVSAACADCGSEASIRRPITQVTASAARCPTCGKERRLLVVHTIDDDVDPGLTAAALGLPRNDVLTVRGEEARVHFLVGSPLLDDAPGAIA